jgi:hypothetical protein
MGMYGVLCRVSERQLARIRDDERRAGWLLTNRGPVRSKPWRRLELDKTWDALHRGLGEGAGLANVIHGSDGMKLGPELGFGRPRYLTPAQVAECAAALTRFPEKKLRDRYLAGTVRGAHGNWGPHLMDETATDALAEMHRDSDSYELDILIRRAHELAHFYKKARARSDGMLMTIL